MQLSYYGNIGIYVQGSLMHKTGDSHQVSRVTRKSVDGFSDMVSTNRDVQSQKMARGLTFRIKEVKGLYYLSLISKDLDTYSSIYVAKTKALISCAITVQLICALVFHMQTLRFSHDAAQ